MSCKQCTYRSGSTAAGTIKSKQSVDHAGISLQIRNNYMKIQIDSNAAGQKKYTCFTVKMPDTLQKKNPK
jgi:hypothetical protein